MLVMERNANPVRRGLSRTDKAGLARQNGSIESGLLVYAGNLPRRNNKTRDRLSDPDRRRRLNREVPLPFDKVPRTPSGDKHS